MSELDRTGTYRVRHLEALARIERKLEMVVDLLEAQKVNAVLCPHGSLLDRCVLCQGDDERTE